MATLSDIIETYFKRLLAATGEDAIEIRRCDVAEQFDCVPSQINYVLETRFTPQRGYYVESRRGGGGYIRITRSMVRTVQTTYESLCKEIGPRISADRADRLLRYLEERGLLSARRVPLVRGAVRQETAGIDPPWNDFIRAKLLKAILLVMFHEPR